MPGAGTRTDITTPKRSGWLLELKRAYKARLRRRRLIWRALRKRRELEKVIDRTADIGRDDILAFSTVRNEAHRLPYFLEHHRALGVAQFLIVDNGSDDGTLELLKAQPDVSLWQTTHSYKASRFGVDWINWLLTRYGSGRWCLVVDADELLIYPHHKEQDLRALTGWLQAKGKNRLHTLMLELYPRGPVSQHSYSPGQDPVEVLQWFDKDGYQPLDQPGLRNVVLTGGPRQRMFFAEAPRRAPTMTKMPLVKWHWRYAFVSSTHSLLPRDLNHLPARDHPEPVTGALLHSKFLPEIVERSEQEKLRKQHFAYSEQYEDYYDHLIDDPDFWHADATRFEGWQQLVELGLIRGENWPG